MESLMSRRAVTTIAALLSLSAVPCAPASAQDRAGPSLEDLFTVASLGDVQVAPDGEAVLYTTTTERLDENERDTNVWLIRWDEGGWSTPIQLTHSSETDAQPRWRPDGGAFAFLSERREAPGPGGRGSRTESGRDPERGGQNLYIMDARGGEARLLHDHVTSIAAFEWSPGGEAIVYRAVDDDPEEDERREAGLDISFEDEMGRYAHLWVLDMASGEARRLTEGQAFTVGPFAWSPDGTSVAFSGTPSGRPMDSWKSDVFTIAVGDEDAPPTRLTTNPGPDANPRWTLDGSHIVYSGRPSDRYEIGHRRVYRIPARGGEPEDVSPDADLQPGAYTLTPDGLGAFFQATTGTTRGWFHVDLASGALVRLTPDEGVYGSAGFSADGTTMVFAYQNPTSPEELFAVDLGRSPGQGTVTASTPLTRHNAHAVDFAVGRTEVLQWKGADGREVEGVVVYPVGWSESDGPRALVVRIHGGPSGVYVENFQASSSSNNAQWMAADGYAVLLPNPRGSSGYGEEGLQSVIGDWGGLDFQDIMAGVDTLVERGVAHRDSLGVMGWSYGGYMTAWTVTQTSRFKAAVAGAAITENIAMWGTQDIQHVFEAYFGGGPYEEGLWDIYQASNPMAFIDQATTPTLMIHGEEDPRVPPNQALIFYRGLKANGVNAKLLWLPRTPHGPREPGLRYETARNQKEWMDQWIRRRPIS
jgi:dipeptidyl aminopeptidase/acylaminoacyl peptidase